RNDPVRPTRGWDFSFDQEFTGLGGSVKYLKTKADWRMYHGFTDDFQATLKLSAGYIDGIGQNVVINDRFFIGGSDFRGFERAGVGARDLETDDALGAEAFAIASAELTFPNFLPEALDIDTSLFIDAGFVGLSDDENIFDSSGDPLTDVQDKLAPRVAAGLSVYWKSPFGPVRLDFSHALLQEDYDKTEAFRFSAGARF
ncbi:MAG: BamA/TamA family outer membrane protein, partial [Rhodobiaceae bacterium]|nr:BamA/TamA family outer membrane protein [Rhodobiaceae bacterium]